MQDRAKAVKVDRAVAEYIVRLVGQVVKVSVGTVEIVKSLPKEYSTSQMGTPVSG